ncbi:MAG: RtcB family protein, partial [bacterium]|nr:RtcB family protein [bacterium]
MALINKHDLERVDDVCWRIPRRFNPAMRVDGLVFADDPLLDAALADDSLAQVANVACLPGIEGASLAMPDIHLGYGFCIGGVCATDPAAGGVISPGGVGYDINCGVRLLRTDLNETDVRPRLETLVTQLFSEIPSGVGRSGPFRFDHGELRRLMAEGPRRLLAQGLATERDLEFTESGGRLEGADPEAVSDRALDRGADQCGTLGSGNHFLEVQVVEEIEDPPAARVMGLREGGVCV